MRSTRPCASGFVLLLVLGSSVLQAEQDFFPFSVWYSGGKARAPMLEAIDAGSRERWKRDLEQIKSLGFNAVRTWVEWTACEPRPGQYRFENLRLLAELAQEAGLKFLVQVYVDSAPDWVGERFPDARFVAQSGEVIPSQAAPGYCFDHQEVRQKILDFYRETARVAARFSNFLGWDLWSEPHIINWAIIDFIPNATFCYCPHTQNRFRKWLQDKYGNLEAVNKSWYRTFTDWKQVEPPRFGTILSYTDFIDWRLFIQKKLAEDLETRAEAVRSIAAGPVVSSHAAVPCLFTSPLWGIGAPDDWLMVDSVDYWGTSIYPKHSFPTRHWSLLQLSVLSDFIRSSGRKRGGFYVGEFQAGMGIRGTVVGDPITAEDQELWLWTLLSRGARAINVYAYYPMSSGYEAGGYGLINLDGTVTPRAEALGERARLVNENQKLFLNSVPAKAEVAAVYNPLAFLAGGEQHLSQAGAVRDSLTGIYRAFWRKNIPFDFVHLQEVEKGTLGNYKVVFLPYPLMLTARAAHQLRQFVEQGGMLAAEARCGWNDERGYSQHIIPGFGLDQVFQAREGRLKMTENLEIQIAGSHALLGRLRNGDLLQGRGIQEELVPYPEARILAKFSDGSVAVTVADYGEGKAIAVGSFLGMANAQERHENTETFFVSLAEAAGVQAPLEMSGVPEDVFVEARLLESEGARLLFVFNHSDQRVSPRFSLGTGWDLESGETANLSSVTLKSREIRVFRVTP